MQPVTFKNYYMYVLPEVREVALVVLSGSTHHFTLIQ